MIKDNEEEFFSLLHILDKVFKKHDIEYWLSHGSLVGAIREGTYIEWDGDMDVSVHFKDIKRVRQLKREFEKYGVSLTGFIKSGVATQNASICIFILYPVKKHGKRYLVQYSYPIYAHMSRIMGMKVSSMLEKSKFYWFLCSKIKRIEMIHSYLDALGNYAYIPFCGIIAPIPEYPDEYLTYTFGDWRTPHKFKTHRDVNNMYKVKIYK